MGGKQLKYSSMFLNKRFTSRTCSLGIKQVQSSPPSFKTCKFVKWPLLLPQGPPREIPDQDSRASWGTSTWGPVMSRNKMPARLGASCSCSQGWEKTHHRQNSSLIALPKCGWLPHIVCLIFETGSHYTVQTSLKLTYVAQAIQEFMVIFLP